MVIMIITQGRRHGLDWGWTPTFARAVPEIDANPVSFYWGRAGRRGSVRFGA